MFAIVIVIMIISSTVCILYCNYLTSSYKKTDEKAKTIIDEEAISSGEEQKELAMQMQEKNK
jgi:hypothetical protein